jgi:hypothetical protein
VVKDIGKELEVFDKPTRKDATGSACCRTLAPRGMGLLVVFALGFAAAALLAGSADALVPGDTADVTGTYTSSAVTSSADPNFDACASMPQPPEPFWGAVDGNIHISDDVPGNCSSVGSPDPAQPGQTRFDLTYTYTASWGYVIPADTPPRKLTLTIRFHTADNVVSTATYDVTSAPSTSGSTGGGATTTSSTTVQETTTTVPSTTIAVTTTSPDTSVQATTVQTVSVTQPPPPATVTASTTSQAETVTSPTTVPAPRPVAKRYSITAPSTITVSRGARVVTVTISTNSDAPMLLCYRASLAAKQTCKAGRRTWKITLPSKPDTTVYVFVLKKSTRVVAKKTITLKVK